MISYAVWCKQDCCYGYDDEHEETPVFFQKSFFSEIYSVRSNTIISNYSNLLRRGFLSGFLFSAPLRILASYKPKTAKISNRWTFWCIIKLINHLFKI